MPPRVTERINKITYVESSKGHRKEGIGAVTSLNGLTMGLVYTERHMRSLQSYWEIGQPGRRSGGHFGAWVHSVPSLCCTVPLP